jgi:heat shock protein HspQ
VSRLIDPAQLVGRFVKTGFGLGRYYLGMKSSQFYVGQLVEHMKFGYRGVVFSVDAEFSLSEEWYDQVAKSRPPKDQPWYHVLVDQGDHATYVAERHLAASARLEQIEHPALGEFFGRFDGERYLPKRALH